MFDHGDFKQGLKQMLVEKRQAAKNAQRQLNEWCEALKQDFCQPYTSNNSNITVECRVKNDKLFFDAYDKSWYAINVELVPGNGYFSGLISTRGFKGNKNRHKFIVEDYQHLFDMIDQADGVVGRYMHELNDNTK